jgi:hypothetical protein
MSLEETTEAKAPEYDVSMWKLKSFIQAWMKNSDVEDWDTFYAAMAAECFNETSTKLPENKLQARLKICARHLREMKLKPPAHPPRPPRVVSLKDAVIGLGLEPL